MTETSTTGETIDPAGVNHPAHYNVHPSGVECIDLVRDLGFDIGSAVKYVFRRGEKGDPVKDLGKALWYFEDAQRTLTEPDPVTGNLRARFDLVIAFEPDRTARRFYAAVARADFGDAAHHVRALLREAGGFAEQPDA